MQAMINQEIKWSNITVSEGYSSNWLIIIFGQCVRKWYYTCAIIICTALIFLRSMQLLWINATHLLSIDTARQYRQTEGPSYLEGSREGIQVSKCSKCVCVCVCVCVAMAIGDLHVPTVDNRWGISYFPVCTNWADQKPLETKLAPLSASVCLSIGSTYG